MSLFCALVKPTFSIPYTKLSCSLIIREYCTYQLNVIQWITYIPGLCQANSDGDRYPFG